ncbi:hypothetical protein BDB01DRAFT_845233 [Pilobolus umbonatus]|nr:hypothetical protein BDB01DRAFT_845233 [Pilobolus umbonatus]
MAQFLSTIYSPYIGVEVQEGGVQRRVQQNPAVAIQAVNDAEAAMSYCREEVLPELDSIDQFVIRPSLELQELVKKIQKTIVKRNHKLLDYDRHRVALSKLTVKEQRTFNDEKAILKLQNQLDIATKDYEYLNNALKQDLPSFFLLQHQFMQPIFTSMYYLQNKIYGMIYARTFELLNANEQHFVTHAMGIEEGFNWRKGQYNAQEEIESLDLLKSGGKAWLTVSGGANSSKLTLQERAQLKNSNTSPISSHQNAYQSDTSFHQNSYQPEPSFHQTSYQAAPPAYQEHKYAQPATSYTSPTAPIAPTGLVPPKTAIPPRVKINYVLALYDYDAQAEGDLSFKKDDKIQLISRTDDTNDWWTGKLRGTVGVFPGNYVMEL